MQSILSRTIVTLVCLSVCAALVLADTIKLKNGSVIKGKVTTFNDREFTVMLDVGASGKRSSSRLVLAVDDVESIQFDGQDNGGAAFTNPSAVTREAPPKEPVAKEPVKPAPTTPTFSNTPAPSQPVSQSATTTEGSLADKTVSVIAAADWTSTEIRVRKGQRITISATGQIDLGGNRRSGPEGTPVADPKKLIPNVPTGALIAVIGDDNDDFISIGPQTSFVAEREGILFLSVNETNLKDNTGSFVARIRVFAK